jgi:proteasome lid subunit RPN8/RPN11
VILPRGVRQAIVAHARRERPRECCGLLVGSGREVAFAVAATNVAPGETRYRVDDREHIQLRRVLRSFSPPLEILGVYHSHPRGDARPSATDVAEAAYADWFHVIVGLKAGRAAVAAFRLTAGTVWPVTLRASRPGRVSSTGRRRA